MTSTSTTEWTAPYKSESYSKFSFANLLETYTDSIRQDTADAEFLRGAANLGLSSPEYSLGPAGGLSVSHKVSVSENRAFYNDSLTTRTTPMTNTFSLQARQKPLGFFNTSRPARSVFPIL